MLSCSVRCNGRLIALLYIELELQIKFWAIDSGCAVISGCILKQTILGLREMARGRVLELKASEGESKGGRLICSRPTSLVL